MQVHVIHEIDCSVERIDPAVVEAFLDTELSDDPMLADSICAMAPNRVVYVSCDPATLARDLKRFTQLGYRAEQAVGVDLFCRTSHVETIVLLQRETL